jgi:hypothetical protein
MAIAPADKYFSKCGLFSVNAAGNRFRGLADPVDQ